MFEIAMGYRELRLHEDFGHDQGTKYFTYYGFDPLRFAFGPRFTVSKTSSVELTAHVSTGVFVGQRTNNCDGASSSDFCNQFGALQHFFAGIHLGWRFDL